MSFERSEMEVDTDLQAAISVNFVNQVNNYPFPFLKGLSVLHFRRSKQKTRKNRFTDQILRFFKNFIFLN